MRILIAAVACAAATAGLTTAPIAGAYPNCAAARAAGAAPLYAGQPGYSSKLDRDGDGVACETGGGGSGSVSSSGGLPLYGSPPAPVATGPATQAPSAPAAAGLGYTTVVTWTGADCIDITAPSGAAGTLQTVSHCGGRAELVSNGVGDQMVGADPVIDAGSLSCEILDGRLMDSGIAGDGHDVNCLTRASALS
ncbi:excalibur calcium-binding domain-containing protein [Mycolicibacterium houstonense]|uniref:excalibur calcium-binding domain-containing protein n=2 Tax=Mycolicibacterium houstonense TaxID=146021 RepID=UPI000939922D|nr:excalibur calcium-binding domain-containing protein [Mycolicibacterium houstonense]